MSRSPSPSCLSVLIADRLDELLARRRPDAPGIGLVVALSGGPDSVALLLLARNWATDRDRPLAAAHFNHQLRGEASEGDAAFCRDLCHRLHIPLFTAGADARPLARARGGGLEEAARALRRDFFLEVLGQNPEYGAVATGHHRDDQTETVLMRLLRGTGPDGMAGIRPLSGRIIHPLLGVTRARILEYLQQKNQPWRTDATNLGGDNTRSRLRQELLPVIRSIFGEGAEAGPARLAGLWEQDLDFLETQTLKALQEVTEASNGRLMIPALLDLHTALASRVLRRWLLASGTVDPTRLEAIHVQNILDWLRVGTSGQSLDIPGGLRLLREFENLKILPREAIWPVRNSGDFRILVARSAPVTDPEGLGRTEGNGVPTPQGGWNLTCPASVLQGNLRVRNWRRGDRLRPLGLDGSRKLSDLFREKRMPASDRPGVLVVEDDGGILWAVGLARSERTRLSPGDAALVTISVVPRRDPDTTDTTDTNTH